MSTSEECPGCDNRKLRLSGRERTHIAAKPLSQFSLRESSVCNGEHGIYSIALVRLNYAAIFLNERERNDEARALVAIHESMIANNSHSVSGGKIGEIGHGTAVGGEVLGPR